MPRPRIYLNDAERVAAYRERKKLKAETLPPNAPTYAQLSKAVTAQAKDIERLREAITNLIRERDLLKASVDRARKRILECADSLL